MCYTDVNKAAGQGMVTGANFLHCHNMSGFQTRRLNEELLVTASYPAN